MAADVIPTPKSRRDRQPVHRKASNIGSLDRRHRRSHAVNTRPLHNRFFALEIIAAAVLLPGAMAMPALAADPGILSNAASDAAPDMKPADDSTPTVAANDIDDQKVTVRIKIALAGDNTLSPQAHEVSVATNPEAVILRGSVSSGEKERINSVAEEYAGARQIIDELLVRDM